MEVREEWMSNKKPSNLEQVEDPVNKLPLYLSQYALHDFNMKQSARSCFTLKQDEFYENVNVVNSLRINSAIENTTTYLITFEASLPADNTTQTFITKISFSPLPTVKIGFRFVKIKGEENDYQEQEDKEEEEEEEEDNLSDLGGYEDDTDIDSESVVEDHSQDNLPEFHKKDSQENISAFSDRLHTKDSEENLPKSGDGEPFKVPGKNLLQFDNEKHSKDSEENLSEFDEKDTKKRVRYYCHPDTHFKPLRYKYKGSELSKEIESFTSDVAKSDGFEVGHYPLMDATGIHGTWIYKFYDRETKTLGTTDMNQLVCLSRLAICVYNMEKDKYFDNVKVLKAMTSGCAGVKYNLTFEASLPDHIQKFFKQEYLQLSLFRTQRLRLNLLGSRLTNYCRTLLCRIWLSIMGKLVAGCRKCFIHFGDTVR